MMSLPIKCALLASLLLLTGVSAARADEVAPGSYRVAEGPDVAGGLQIASDGSFRYMLAAGALDELAQGVWRKADGGIALFSEPRPVAPEFSVEAMTKEGEAPFTLLVVWPNGESIAGIDFRVGFANGETAESYTQHYGWSTDLDARGAPVWVELFDSIHGIASPRFAIPAGTRTVAVRYTPNDLGTVDFQGALVTAGDDGGLLLHRGEGVIRFVRGDE